MNKHLLLGGSYDGRLLLLQRSLRRRPGQQVRLPQDRDDRERPRMYLLCPHLLLLVALRLPDHPGCPGRRGILDAVRFHPHRRRLLLRKVAPPGDRFRGMRCERRWRQPTTHPPPRPGFSRMEEDLPDHGRHHPDLHRH